MQFDYAWRGLSHYLAIHDLVLADGETVMDGLPPVHARDLRDRMTFAPRGCAVEGWTSLTARQNSYMAITFDDDLLEREFGVRALSDTPPPRLYFNDDALGLTLSKMKALLLGDTPADPIYAETLALVAILELSRVRIGGTLAAPGTGKLSSVQEHRVVDFVDANLDQIISLDAMAAVAGLSRFHFARAFKRTFGLSPHQFVLARRLDKAKWGLARRTESIARVAAGAGFTSQAQFSHVFRRHTGMSPREFRRSSGPSR